MKKNNELVERLQLAIDEAISDNYAVFNYCNKVRKRVKEAPKICLYGLGNFYNDYVKNVKRYDYVCDSDSRKHGLVFNGRKCLSPLELSKMKDVVTLIMVGNYAEVKKELDNIGVESYYFGDLYLNSYDEHYSTEWFRNNKKEILEGIDLFEDEESKEVYVNVICNRIAPKYSKKKFHDLEVKGEYFESGIFSLTDNECFVDAGAYDGDSILQFIKSVDGKYKEIYGFEMDSINYKMMKKNLSIYNDNRIKLFKMGLSNQYDMVKICSNGTCSHIERDTGEYNVELNALDNILKNEKVTFIKMDIEGAEVDALEGSKNIITKNHPKLAVSTYHKLEHMWMIPKWIKNISTQYKLYLRHHTAVVWDTDCYAVFN